VVLFPERKDDSVTNGRGRGWGVVSQDTSTTNYHLDIGSAGWWNGRQGQESSTACEREEHC